jgi:hypothetical protein
MAYKERIGATGDSLRIKNNEWYIARSFNQDTDIKIFRVNVLDQIEFWSVPSVNGDSFVLQSQFEELEERVAILEEIVESISAGDVNIVAYELTPQNITDKFIILPQSPLPTSTALIMPEEGIPQLQDVDFQVVGDVLDWDGLPYELVAQAGDNIKVMYMFGYTP